MVEGEEQPLSIWKSRVQWSRILMVSQTPVVGPGLDKERTPSTSMCCNRTSRKTLHVLQV